jgi:hypothetical protein
MRRTLVLLVAAAALAATGWAAHAATTHATPAAPQPADPIIGSSVLTAQLARDRLAATRRAALIEAANMFPVTAATDSAALAAQLAKARIATAKYATNLRAAKADGYQLITRMIPDMGWHFLNPTIQGFDVTKPAILVYERHGRSWQLGALEWVFTETPATPPLPGATYGSFAAACHYQDGTFVFARVQELCAKRSPETGARFSFWHPDLVTLHVWLWYPNPGGLYNGTNPLIRPFNHG